MVTMKKIVKKNPTRVNKEYTMLNNYKHYLSLFVLKIHFEKVLNFIPITVVYEYKSPVKTKLKRIGF